MEPTKKTDAPAKPISEQAKPVPPAGATIAGNAVVAFNQGGQIRKPIDLSSLKVKAALSIPVLQCSKEGQKVLIEILEPIHAGPKMKADTKKEPAMIAKVVNLEDGRVYQFIFSAVVRNEINNYFPTPENAPATFVPGYVGQWFAIEAGARRVKGKDPETGEAIVSKFRDYGVLLLEKQVSQ